ncbi:cytochrome c [Ectothiorhodospiraceae bacterium 2226]|nr:cytochrome c [Ectothiorhodospiraceae bacterium 2226]
MRSGLVMASVLAGALWTASAAAAERPSFQAVMQGLAADMQRLSQAIFMEDFPAMAEAAEAVADHPKPADQDRRRVMAAVGPDVERFRAYDHAVHEGAERIAEAARATDMDGVLRYHAQVMQGCVACHSTFRGRMTQAPAR